MATARVNGIEIDYQDTGRGRPILLTHGHMSSRVAWNGQHETLVDRYRVISWDIRGHGQTVSPDDPAQYSLDLAVADVSALLGHLGLERAVYMAKKIHGARLETITGAGHSSNLDQPEAFNRVLLDFLDSLPSGR